MTTTAPDTTPTIPTDEDLAEPFQALINIGDDLPTEEQRRAIIVAGRRANYNRGTNDGFTIAMLATTASISEVALETAEERQRQDTKWGEQNHPDGTGPDVLPLNFAGIEYSATQLERWAKRTTDRRADAGTVTWLDILREEYHEALAQKDPAKLREELIQLAAVAQQWVESIDRRTMALAASGAETSVVNP